MTIEVRKDPAAGAAVVTITTSLDRLDSLLSALSLTEETIAGKNGGEISFVPLSSVDYFESVDNRLFFYTERETYECPARLKQIEEELGALPFARVSKTVIVNLERLRSIRPEKNSRLIAAFLSGEQVVVNRQYVRSIREKLGV